MIFLIRHRRMRYTSAVRLLIPARVNTANGGQRQEQMEILLGRPLSLFLLSLGWPREMEAVVLPGSTLRRDLRQVVWLLPHTCSRGELYPHLGDLPCTGQRAEQAKRFGLAEEIGGKSLGRKETAGTSQVCSGATADKQARAASRVRCQAGREATALLFPHPLASLPGI